MTGALYFKTDNKNRTFVYNCTVLGFDQANDEVKIRYVIPPAMMNTAVVRWVSINDLKLYIY